MALERIDPFSREDRFCLDHLLRYCWMQPLVAEKRVLDVACGLGFGSILLAEANASAVAGVDLDEATIAQCRNWWNHPRIEFASGSIEQLNALALEPFDVVCSFETLEHIEDPKAAVASIRSVLKKDGLFLGSVPGETDWLEENEYHLQFFDPQRLAKLLQEQFTHVKLFQQRFLLASRIEETGTEAGSAIRKEAIEAVTLDFGGDERLADSYIFMASDGDLPDIPERSLGLSRQAWSRSFEDAARSSRELDRLYGRFRKVFFQHGDLKRRFTNVLAWGKYWHEQANGKEPEQAYLDKIEHAKSSREADLRAEVASLQRENERLRKELDAVSQGQGETSKQKRKQFLEGLKSFMASAD